MREYRAVFFDLDGTVVESRPEAEPSPTVTAEVRLALNRDVLVSVATGRPFEMARHIFRTLGLVQFCVVNGGAEIVDPVTERVIVSQFMTNESQGEVIETARKFGASVRDSHNQHLGGVAVKTVYDVPASNTKLLIPALELTQAKELIEALSPVEGVAALYATSWSGDNRFDVHVTDSEATKAHAIALLTDMLNVTKAETAGVGDSDNDEPMFREVGLKVAVDNATPDLKAIADVIAPSLAEDGAAWVLREYFS